MDDERIRLLTDIGFAWEVQRGGKRRNHDLPNPALAKKKPKRKQSKKNLVIPAGKAVVGGEDGAPVNFSRKHPTNMNPMQQLEEFDEMPQDQMAMQQRMQMQQTQMLFQHHLQQQQQQQHALHQQNEQPQQEEETDQKEQQQQQHSFTPAVAGQDWWQRPGQQVLIPLHAMNGVALPTPGVFPVGRMQPGQAIPLGMSGRVQYPIPANMPGMVQYPVAATMPGMMPNPMFAMAAGMTQPPPEKFTPLQAALAASNNRSAYDPPRWLQRQNLSQSAGAVHTEQSRRKREDP